ncbi:MAG: response regulator transcription factor [Spongiibacteraceae bacterium]|nr:response regulator transcription factor [Spongiibacteraceae bacterium]
MQRTIIIADDHPLFRNALKQTIANTLDNADIVEAHDIVSLQSCVEKHPQTDLILLDLHMPGAHGFSGIIHLNAHHPQIPVIIVSAHESSEIIRRALDHGVAGFLPKSSPLENISSAVEKVLAGGRWLPLDFDPDALGSSDEERSVANILSTLTPQQFRVATMLAQGLLNKQIAYELNVTEATVKAHITEIFRKFGVQSRTQAVLAMSRLDVQAPGDHSLN